MKPQIETVVLDHLGDSSTAWLRWVESGSLEDRNTLVEHYFPWVRKVSSKFFLDYGNNLVEWQDIVHMCSVALIKSIDSFNINQGVPFEAYAYKHLRFSALDGIKVYCSGATTNSLGLASDYNQDRIPKSNMESDPFDVIIDTAIELAFGKFLELGILQIEAEDNSSYRAYEQDFDEKLLVSLVDRLEEKQKFVVKSHYFQHLRFSEISDILGISPARVSQIHKNAISSLRTLFEKSS